MAMDRGILEKQLQALGESSSWWQERELRDLPAVLQPDEEIRAIARGKIGRLRRARRTWLIVVTNTRLVCLRSARTSWRQFELRASLISRVALRMKFVSGRLLVSSPDGTYRFHFSQADALKVSRALSSVANCGEDTLSGATHMVRRVINHVLSLPTAVLNPQALETRAVPAPDHSDTEQRLHEQIQELQQQVRFLEQLLRQRQLGAADEQSQLQSSASYSPLR